MFEELPGEFHLSAFSKDRTRSEGCGCSPMRFGTNKKTFSSVSRVALSVKASPFVFITSFVVDFVFGDELTKGGAIAAWLFLEDLGILFP